MKRLLGLAMTLALILGVTATSFAGGGPKTKQKAAAAKNAVLLKNKVGKQTKHRKHHRHHRRGRKMSHKTTTNTTTTPTPKP